MKIRNVLNAVLFSTLPVILSTPAQGQEPTPAPAEHVHGAQEEAEDAAPTVAEVGVDVQVRDIASPSIKRHMQLVQFESPGIGRLTKFFVLLPDDYDTSEKRYPVLYLLHGFSQNYTVWPMLGVPEAMAGKDLIVVMPDAGNSWYINWSISEEGQINNWEDFIIYDLIPTVDSVYRTIPRRQGRAINGLSMGGYGALTLGLLHFDMFCSIGSQSGALDYARNARARIGSGVEPKPMDIDIPISPLDQDVPEVIAIEGFTTQAERYPKGVPLTTVEECNYYDPFDLVLRIPVAKLPHIYLDCGTEDGLIKGSREFATLLMENDIPFTFAQSPGEHRPSYWSRESAHSIAVQYTIIERSLEYMYIMDERNRLAAEAAAAAAADEEGAEASPALEPPASPPR